MMRQLSKVVLLTMALMGPLAPAQAFTEAELAYAFDARRLSSDEKRFLQTALAFEGSYNGLLDGAWGSGSQRALERHVSNAGVIGEPQNWSSSLLALDAWERFEAEVLISTQN